MEHEGDATQDSGGKFPGSFPYHVGASLAASFLNPVAAFFWNLGSELPIAGLTSWSTKQYALSIWYLLKTRIEEVELEEKDLGRPRWERHRRKEDSGEVVGLMSHMWEMIHAQERKG